MQSLLILAPFLLFGWANSAECSYARLSTRHTSCIEPNLSCDIRHSGVKKEYISEILNTHNRLRSYVAIGKESRSIGGTLPKAADMMQMVWDEELAFIAQKWADNCVYEHDCNDCRAVEDYPVGQNIAYQDWICSDQRCFDGITEKDLKPEWEKVLDDFYMEVVDFDVPRVRKFQSNPSKVIGHFTQMIWSKSWRVGCGYTVFRTGFNYRRFYVCNYGPTGNMRNEPIYKEGAPCSACPMNSCCGPSCKKAMDFEGLCKMYDPKTAPVFPWNSTGLIFNCHSERNAGDCAAKVTSGVDKWQFHKDYMGSYVAIVLDGGESSTVTFSNRIVPTEKNFCVRFHFREGPVKAGEKSQSHLQANFIPIGYQPVHIDITNNNSPNYENFKLDLTWKASTEFSLTFSVEDNANPQMLEIREIIAFNGRCNSKKF